MILWKRLDRPGHESCRIRRTESGWALDGSAVFEHEQAPVALRYEVSGDPDWTTLEARVNGWVADRDIDVVISRDRHGNWTLNGEIQPQVSGAVDVDLNFSPSTNLLPIRRLDLEIGASATVRAAWLRFPSFTLEPLEQTYTRIAQRRYRYQSSSFVAEIEVDESGLPISYAGVWERAT